MACRSGSRPVGHGVAFAIDAAAIVGYVALGFPNGPFLATVLITLGVMSRLTDRRTALIGAAALCAALTLAELVAVATTGSSRSCSSAGRPRGVLR